jgi:hypothetical protein
MSAMALEMFVFFAQQVPGLSVCRAFVSQTDASAVADALDSPDANERAWTGLKLVGDSVKTYTGTRDGMLMMDGKYRKVWGWWLFHHVKHNVLHGCLSPCTIYFDDVFSDGTRVSLHVFSNGTRANLHVCSDGTRVSFCTCAVTEQGSACTLSIVFFASVS